METRFNDICNELDRRGCKVYVLTYQPLITKARGLSRETRGNITIFRIPWIGFDLFHKLKPYPVLQALYLCPVLFVRSFVFLLKNHGKIDVIHSAGFNAGLVGRALKAFFKKRWVVSTHAIYGLNPKSITARILKWILRRADVILTLSEPSRQELIKIGIAPEKLVNQITWVNQEIFKPLDREECRKKLSLKERFTVLFVGRLLEIKGIRLLAELATEESFRDTDFVFIGAGPLENYLREQAKAHKNIIFAGRVENFELPIYYNAADVFVMPSQYKEGLGRVVVEALSCGIPVVASDLGGLADILDSSVAIMVNPVKEKIRHSIVYIKSFDKFSFERMRKNARDFAERVFNKQNCEVILKAYNFI